MHLQRSHFEIGLRIGNSFSGPLSTDGVPSSRQLAVQQRWRPHDPRRHQNPRSKNRNLGLVSGRYSPFHIYSRHVLSPKLAAGGCTRRRQMSKRPRGLRQEAAASRSSTNLGPCATRSPCIGQRRPTCSRTITVKALRDKRIAAARALSGAGSCPSLILTIHRIYRLSAAKARTVMNSFHPQDPAAVRDPSRQRMHHRLQAKAAPP